MSIKASEFIIDSCSKRNTLIKKLISIKISSPSKFLRKKLIKAPSPRKYQNPKKTNPTLNKSRRPGKSTATDSSRKRQKLKKNPKLKKTCFCTSPLTKKTLHKAENG